MDGTKGKHATNSRVHTAKKSENKRATTCEHAPLKTLGLQRSRVAAASTKHCCFHP